MGYKGIATQLSHSSETLKNKEVLKHHPGLKPPLQILEGIFVSNNKKGQETLC